MEDGSDESSLAIFPEFRKRPKFDPSIVEIDVGGTDDRDTFSPWFRPFFVNPFKNLGGFSGMCHP